MIPNIPTADEHLRRTIRSANDELRRRDNPTTPVKLPSYTTDKMPNAADYSGAQLWNTTISRVCVSDGTNWLRQDNGTAV